MLWDEPQDGCQMEGVARYVGSTLRFEGHVFNHPVDRGGSDHCGTPLPSLLPLDDCLYALQVRFHT